jgi:hypothetical protein
MEHLFDNFAFTAGPVLSSLIPRLVFLTSYSAASMRGVNPGEKPSGRVIQLDQRNDIRTAKILAALPLLPSREISSPK